MKGTLRKVNEGIIFTIDERPKYKDYYFDVMFQDWVQDLFNVCADYNDTDLHKILASTFGVGLGLSVRYMGWFGEDTMSFDSFVKVWSKAISLDQLLSIEHPYTIQDNKVIIEL